MKDFLEWLIELGPAGLMIAALLDGAGLPIPSGVDALLVFISNRRDDTGWLIAVTVLGSTLGNFILFLLARRGGEKYLQKRASPRRMRFRQWFHRYGLLTVFISALVPLPIMPMKIFVLCSGALGSAPSKFLAAFLGARIPRYIGLAYLGKSMGTDAMAYLKANALYLGLAALALFIFLALLVRFADRQPAQISTQ